MPLQYDPQEAIDHINHRDPRLGEAIDRLGPFALQVRRWPQPFHALLRSIVYQQLSGRAAGTIFARFQALFSGPHPAPEEVLARAPDALRGAGLSRAKAAAVLDLAARARDGQVPSRQKMRFMSDAQIIDCLTQVRGVGRWTVEMLLLFDLGRADVMPATDLGIRKGFQLVYGKRKLPEPDALLRHSRRWQPYRSVASWYLWRAVDGQGGAM